MTQHSSAKKFRTDVNGLRAWAVVAVILYHFDVRGFSGGFIGVDVFFVISGFLMMGIIVRGLEEQSAGGKVFSILNFYLARAKRIVPALLALCAVLICFGWFFLSTADYQTLGKQIISALGFFSNIKFWKETGYFAPNAHQIWLLHTWSLSVEWQFYLILPLVLMGVWKLSPRRQSIIILIAAGAVLSLALSIWLMKAKQGTAFFLLPPRAWELLVGALVYMAGDRFIQSERQRKIVEGIGLLMICAAVVGFDSRSSWPGWRALVPVTGSALVLLAARQESFWTGSKLAQWVGNSSYSLYLWHWPIVVALVYLEEQDNPIAVVTGLLLTIVIGHLSYLLIENRTRPLLAKFSSTKSAVALTMAMSAILVPIVVMIMQSGMPFRLPVQARAIFAAKEDRNPRMAECLATGITTVPECTYGGKKLGVIVLGDSHSASIMRAVEKALPSRELHVLDWSLTGCMTTFEVKRTNDPAYRCGEFLKGAAVRQQQFPRDVPMIIMNRTSLYAMGPNEPGHRDEVAVPDKYFTRPYETRSPEFYKELRNHIIDTACYFAKYRPVYLMRPTPEMNTSAPISMGLALLLGRAREISISMDEYSRRHAFVFAAQDAAKDKCGVMILDPLPYFCHDERCYGAKDGLPVFYDSNHLSEHGANYLIPLFMNVFKLEKSAIIESADSHGHK